MLVQRNLARTTQPARPVLQTEITNVCAFPGLVAMIVKTVGETFSLFFWPVDLLLLLCNVVLMLLLFKVVLRPKTTKKIILFFFGFQNYVN